jgi:excisionase family DNA binding protein
MQTMNYQEAAAFLKITQGTLRNWVFAGRIKRHKLGKRVLFFKEELEAWIVNPTPPSAGSHVPNPEKQKPVPPPVPPAPESTPDDWDARFQLSFSGKADAETFALLENLPGKNVRMTPDNMRELARYLVDAASMCENPSYRGIKHHRLMRESGKSLSAVCLIPHDYMHDLKTLSLAATRTNDPNAVPPERYVLRFVADGLRLALPMINQRLEERGKRAIKFITVR